MTLRRIYAATGFVCLVALVTLAAHSLATYYTHTRPAAFQGSRVPAFQLTAQDGRLVSGSQLHGRPFAILFVQQGCPHCLHTLAHLDGARDLSLPLLVVQPRQPRESALADELSVAARKYLFYNGRDLANSLGIKVTPTALVVSASGIITRAHIGELSAAQLHAFLDLQTTQASQLQPGQEACSQCAVR